MFCTNCGAKLEENVRFCTQCGHSTADILNAQGAQAGPQVAQAGSRATQANPQATQVASQVTQVVQPVQPTQTPAQPTQRPTQPSQVLAQPTQVMRPVQGYPQAGQQFSAQANGALAPHAGDAPATQVNPQAAAQQELPSQNSKSKKSTYVIVGVVVLALCAAVAALAYAFASGLIGGGQNASAPQNSTQEEQSSSASDDDSASKSGTDSSSSSTSDSSSDKSSSDAESSTTITSRRTVTVKVTTTSGSTLTGTVGQDASGYVIADSSTRKYTADEIRAMNLTDAELCIAWNEPYARAGYTFMNSGLKSYFNSCSWYKGTSSTVEVSSVAEENVATIRAVAEESASAKQWEDLAKN